MRRFLVFLIALSSCAYVEAEVCLVRTDYKTCASNRSCKYTSGYTTGTTIFQFPDGTLYVLTVAHGVGEGTRTFVYTPDPTPARVVAMKNGRGFDVAVLSLRTVRKFACNPLYNGLPQAGMKVTVVGFGGPSTSVHYLKGELESTTRVIGDTVRSFPMAPLAFNQRISFGDSGSPILFNDAIVGVVCQVPALNSGVNPNWTFFTSSQEIIPWLTAQKVPFRLYDGTGSTSGAQEPFHRKKGGDSEDGIISPLNPNGDGGDARMRRIERSIEAIGQAIDILKKKVEEQTSPEVSPSPSPQEKPQPKDHGEHEAEIGQKESVVPVVLSKAADVALLVVPWVLGIGATGGTGALAIWGARLALQALRSRRKRRKKKPMHHPEQGAGGGNTVPGGFPGQQKDQPVPEMLERDHTETEQYIQLRLLERRDPLLDALTGIVAQDVLHNAAESKKSEQLASSAKTFLDQIKERVDQIAPLKADQPYSRNSWRPVLS